MASAADSTFRRPRCSRSWSTWRCRLLSSTTSGSTMPRVPTPAAARYRATGEPRPPGPHQQHSRGEQALLPGDAHLRAAAGAGCSGPAGPASRPAGSLPGPSLGLPAVQAAGQRGRPPVAAGAQRLAPPAGSAPRRRSRGRSRCRDRGRAAATAVLQVPGADPARPGDHPRAPVPPPGACRRPAPCPAGRPASSAGVISRGASPVMHPHSGRRPERRLPAAAGRITSTAPSGTGVSRPCR